MTQPEPGVLVEPNVVVEVVQPKRDRLASMSDDVKLEIASHYANYQIPVEEIVHSYGISNGDVTRIADELAIPRRDRRNVGRKLPAGRFVEGKWVVEPEPETPVASAPEPDIPEDTRLALEQMFNDAERSAPVLPTPPEPVVQRASLPALNMHDTRPYFEASVVGLVRIRASDMMDALEQITSQYQELHVKQIREL